MEIIWKSLIEGAGRSGKLGNQDDDPKLISWADSYASQLSLLLEELSKEGMYSIFSIESSLL